jgi:hypothetical protein
MNQSHPMPDELEAAYREMAQDEAQESEALELAEATVEDVRNEPQIAPGEPHGCEPL